MHFQMSLLMRVDVDAQVVVGRAVLADAIRVALVIAVAVVLVDVVNAIRNFL